MNKVCTHFMWFFGLLIETGSLYVLPVCETKLHNIAVPQNCPMQ